MSHLPLCPALLHAGLAQAIGDSQLELDEGGFLRA